MSPLQKFIIKAASVAAIVGFVVGAAGLLGQGVGVALGAKESPVLITAFSGLATGSLAALGVLAGVVWGRDKR